MKDGLVRKVANYLQSVHGKFTRICESAAMTSLSMAVEKGCENSGNLSISVPNVFSHVPKLSLTLCDFLQRLGTSKIGRKGQSRGSCRYRKLSL